MKKTKYIFLDFDGVLNTGNNSRILRERHLKTSDGFGPLFDPEAIENLGFILKAIPSAKIVVISSWKDIHGLVGLRDMWFERHLPGAIYSTTLTLMNEQLLNVNLDDPAAFNGIEGESKGREILAWMAANNALNDPYVIIDDAVGFPPDLESHLVKTEPNVGLNMKDAEKAIRILNAA
jgi:hypothetical protein